MLEIIEAKQGSDEWWAARMGRPTASQFGNILTPSTEKPSKSQGPYAADLIVERVLGIPLDQMDGFTSPWMEHGTQTEDEARDAYSFLTGNAVREVACGVLDGEIVASPDGLISDDGGLELKCPKPTTHVKYLLAGGLPNEYKCQVHGNMFVFGRQWWDFMSYAPDFPPLIVRVERDEFTEKLGAEVRNFVVDVKAKLEVINSMAERRVA